MNFLKNVEGSKERNIELVMKNEIRDMAILDRIKDIDSENEGKIRSKKMSKVKT